MIVIYVLDDSNRCRLQVLDRCYMFQINSISNSYIVFHWIDECLRQFDKIRKDSNGQTSSMICQRLDTYNGS